ncbi:porin family protein [Sunxiuqinia elliptica]|uniref:Outer membrane protein beta-barrel domain-containing protein n=1 Tax=Sunxiuqinia elliptica TaxID=655355 RepID=A0A1I2EB97_9BACT|nr:porin family protein [Sunxiuqinia elliptica]SFE89979.1 Outer membrane protein beta-barrel domain-containing protein [Sunxiuqinia elliptica]
MKQRLWMLLVLLLGAIDGEAQLFDQYGVSLGATYATQDWDYKSSIYVPSIDYHVGMAAFLFAEKKLNKTFRLRPEIGYIQKGFVDNHEFVSGGPAVEVIDKNVVFHDLQLNLGLKLTPFATKLMPYGVLGIYGDYMLAYDDAVIQEGEDGPEFDMYSSQIDDFKKSNFGGFVGLGLEFDEKLFCELTYSPALTNRFKDQRIQVKDHSVELKLGLKLAR